jgi:hypothetical protein
LYNITAIKGIPGNSVFQSVSNYTGCFSNESFWTSILIFRICGMMHDVIETGIFSVMSVVTAPNHTYKNSMPFINKWNAFIHKGDEKDCPVPHEPMTPK